jgi:hypothetical protein
MEPPLINSIPQGAIPVVVDAEPLVEEELPIAIPDPDIHVLFDQLDIVDDIADIEEPVHQYPRRGPHPITRLNPSVAHLAALNAKMSWSEVVAKPTLVKAMEEELADLIDARKVSVVPTPPGRKPIGSTWAYKLKDVDTDRWKARLCPQGFSQIPGVDFDPNKVASPTVSLLFLVLFHHIVLSRLMYTAAIDFKGAFSNIELAEEIYIRPPRAVEIPLGHSLLLHNSLQGLKQSAYNWYKKLDAFLRGLGFIPNTVEPAQYYRFTGVPPNEKLSLIVTWVDDLKLGFDCPVELEAFWTASQAWLECKRTSGERFIGIDFFYDRDAQPATMKISQRSVIEEALQLFNMVDCNPCSTPASPGTKLSKNMGSVTDAEVADFPFRELVGTLLWLARCTLPETLYSVNQVAAHCHNFNGTHVTAAKRVLRYNKGKLDQVILLTRSSEALVVEGSADADFMGEHEDSLHPARSTSCVTLMVKGQGYLGFHSKLQATVAKSTLASEHRAASEGARMILSCHNVLQEVHYPQSATVLLQDNQACIKAATNATCSNGLRHERNDLHTIRETIAAGQITLVYCPSVDMVSDIGTKALPKEDFQRLNTRLHYGNGF